MKRHFVLEYRIRKLEKAILEDMGSDLNKMKEIESELKNIKNRKQLESLAYEGKRDQEILNNFLGDDYYNKYQLIKNKIKDPEYKDIYKMIKMDPDEVKKYIDSFQSNTDIRRSDKKGATKLYTDDEWVVYRITTYPAAQLYGKNTKWCITGRYPGHEDSGQKYFNDYIRDNNLDGGYYFYINKNDPSEKYCVLQREDKSIHSIWDSSDTNRGSNYYDLDVDLPEVKEVNLNKYSIDGFFSVINKGNVYKVKEYIDKGYDPNIENENGETPLYLASVEGYRDIVELLLNHGADPNIKNENDLSPLSIASGKGYRDIVELLLKHGADPNIKDVWGETPLHWASAKGYKDIVELLLIYDAEPSTKDRSGATPLYKAYIRGYTDVADLLKKYGAIDQ